MTAKKTFKCDNCHRIVDEFYQYSDDHAGEIICEDCFNSRFALAIETKNVDWFWDNGFNRKEYPKLKFLPEKETQ